MWLKNYFTIYIALLIIVIGLYMALIQSSSLVDEKMEREGQFLRILGYVYIGIGIVGVLIYIS